MKSRLRISIARNAALMMVGLPALLAIPFALTAQNTRYKLIDVGTFGGPNSVVNGPGVQDLSKNGTYNGYAETTIPDPYAPNCLNQECLVYHAQKWEDGVSTDLGSLPGINNSGASGISANGIIVGNSQNGLIDPHLGIPEVRAVLFSSDRQVINLGTLPGGTFSFATAVNSRGQAVGLSNNAIPDPFSGLGTQARTFLWQNGVMRDIGTLGGPDAAPSPVTPGPALINEQGQISGASYTNATPNADNGPECPPNTPTTDPFMWDNGMMTDIGTLGGTCGYMQRLNNRGEVVGNSWLAGNRVRHPFFWNRGVLTDIGTFGGSNGEALDLSDSGFVVGEADFPGDFIHHAFVWKNGEMTDVGVVPGDLCSNGRVINSRGQAVGTSTNCMGVVQHMFLWENGAISNLTAMILPGSDVEVVDAWDMNDRGEIAAVGVLPNGDVHAVLLIPASAEEIVAANFLAGSQPRSTAIHRFVKDSDSLTRSRKTRAFKEKPQLP